MKSYFTFGQVHIHPKTQEKLKDYWVEVEAPSTKEARDLIQKIFRNQWASQYLPSEFKKQYWSKGCLMKLNSEDEKSNADVIEEMKEEPKKEECEDSSCKGHTLSETIAYFEKLKEEQGDLRCDAVEFKAGFIMVAINKADSLKEAS